MKTLAPNGLLVLDKPAGITSRAALNRIQPWFPRRTRLGHAGTLDPLATGVLVVCVGAATRLVEYVQRMDKEYVTDLTLGAVSDSDDADGKITVTPDAGRPALEDIRGTLTQFLGWIDQVPPAYSAAKVSGARAHALARQGRDVALAPRRVRIDAIEILSFEFPHLRLRILCGKGTYVRSVARDLGRQLACGGYVRTLRRQRIGPFTTDLAVNFDNRPEPMALLPLDQAVINLPAIAVSPEQAGLLGRGQAVRLADPRYGTVPGGEVAVFQQGRLLATGTWDPVTTQLAPVKVIGSDTGGMD